MINLNPISYYRNLPRRVKEFLEPLVLPLKVSYKNWREIRFNIYILSGKGKGTEATLKTLYITSSEKTSYFIRRVYENAATSVFIKSTCFWNLNRIINEYSSEVDLTLIDMNRLIPYFLKLKNAFLVPSFVRQKLDINKSKEEIIAGFRKNTRAVDLRRIRKFKYSYDIRSDLDSLKFFYEKMHVPYIQKRYPEEASIDSFNDIKKILQHGEILFIKSDGMYVAAALCKKEKECYYFCRLGVFDGNEDFVKKGALSALYYFGIIKAKDENMKTIDFGHSRPLLSDGVLHYKRKWGALVYNDTALNRFFYLILNKPQNISAVFIKQPFVYIDKKELKAVMLLDGHIKAEDFDINNLFDEFSSPGIAAFKVIGCEKEVEYSLVDHA